LLFNKAEVADPYIQFAESRTRSNIIDGYGLLEAGHCPFKDDIFIPDPYSV